MGWPSVPSLATSCKKLRLQTAKEEWNSLQKSNTRKQKNNLDSMWFKKEMPLQSDMLIFYLHCMFVSQHLKLLFKLIIQLVLLHNQFMWNGRYALVKNNEKCGEDNLSNQAG